MWFNKKHKYKKAILQCNSCKVETKFEYTLIKNKFNFQFTCPKCTKVFVLPEITTNIIPYFNEKGNIEVQMKTKKGFFKITESKLIDLKRIELPEYLSIS
jgi:hypothetical protein